MRNWTGVGDDIPNIATNNINNHNMTNLKIDKAMHKVSISPDECNVANETIIQLQSNSKVNGHIFSAVKSEFSSNSNIVKLNIEQGILVLHLSKVAQSMWRINWISADLQRLSMGHSGKDIDSQTLLHSALARLNAVLNIILDAGSQDKAVPGLLDRGRSYWSMLELNVDIDDAALPESLGEVGERCLNLYSNAKLGRNRRAPYIREGESIKFDGAEHSLKNYSKSKQLHNSYHIPLDKLEPSIMRIEFAVKGSKLPKVAGLSGRQKLQTFTIQDTYKMFLTLHSEVKGATAKFHYDLKMSRMEQVIAKAVSLDNNICLEELADVGYRNPKSKSNSLGKIRRYLESKSEVEMHDILPETYSPGYSVAAINQPLGHMIKLDDLDYQRSLRLVENAYTELRSVEPTSSSSQSNPLYNTSTYTPPNYKN